MVSIIPLQSPIVTDKSNIGYIPETGRMRQLFIDFEWQKDNKGYRLLDPEPPAPQKKYIHPIFRLRVEKSLLGRDWGKPQRIARCGGRLVSYRPLEHFDSLFKLFANAADAPGLLGFVEKFGPLTTAGLDKDRGEPIEPMLEHAAAMRAFLDYAAGNKSRLIERIALEHGGVPLSGMTVRLTLDPATRKPRLQLTPRSLLDALWVQLGQTLSGSAVVRQCQHCGQWFEAGAAMGRRADAKFCSKAHKIAFHSLKRSKEN
jgi:hypothetical protein